MKTLHFQPQAAIPDPSLGGAVCPRPPTWTAPPPSLPATVQAATRGQATMSGWQGRLAAGGRLPVSPAESPGETWAQDPCLQGPPCSHAPDRVGGSQSRNGGAKWNRIQTVAPLRPGCELPTCAELPSASVSSSGKWDMRCSRSQDAPGRGGVMPARPFQSPEALWAHSRALRRSGGYSDRRCKLQVQVVSSADAAQLLTGPHAPRGPCPPVSGSASSMCWLRVRAGLMLTAWLPGASPCPHTPSFHVGRAGAHRCLPPSAGGR